MGVEGVVEFTLLVALIVGRIYANVVALLLKPASVAAFPPTTELFVFCVHHADQVQSYVESSTWTSVIKVICVVESSILNAGDALRELDKRGLIRR